MTYLHQQLSPSLWHQLSLVEQLAHVGSEISRTINWRVKDNNLTKEAFYRALHLLTLTKSDPKNRDRLKEICRTYEMLVDWFLGCPQYRSTDQEWLNYFNQFALAARLQK